MFNRINIIMKCMTVEKWFKRHFNNPENFYSDVEELFGQFGPPYGAADNKIIPNGFFWSSLAINVLLKSREYCANPTQKECSSKDEEITQYSFMHTETTLFMLALTALSWLTIDLRKKTENGHCHNAVHTQAKNKFAHCSIGSKFHKQLYTDYVKVLEDFLKKIKERTPTIP
jgi:hypothetical protein